MRRKLSVIEYICPTVEQYKIICLPLKDYLLFIDTEATGLPKKWNLPYTAPGNWPDAVQISWLLYTKEGQKIKEENHYISNNDTVISPGALTVHGLTKNFLQQNGMPRKQVLAILSQDIQYYQPMMVGHFTELDYHIISTGYFKERLDNPIEKLSSFCIMKATQHLQQNPNSKFLRLGQLYELLFKQPLLCQHNAMADAAATADCFFELMKRNEIRSFAQPPVTVQQQLKNTGYINWIILFLLIIFSTFLIAFYYG